jgi:hypothetical protein
MEIAISSRAFTTQELTNINLVRIYLQVCNIGYISNATVT